MKRHRALAFLISISVFCLSVIPVSHAAPLPAGITRGQFAIWLLKESGAIGKGITTAGTEKEAVDFLISLRIGDYDSWGDLTAEVDDAFLRSLLGSSDATGTTEELIKKVQDLVDSSISTADSGVFPVVGASGGAPA